MATTNRLLFRVAVLLTMVAVAFLLLASRATAGNELLETEVHVVQSGETLWEIAQPLTGDGDNIRDTIYDLKRLNGLSDSSLMAGQRLIVPAGG